jgi:hypothetical protein
MGSRKDLHIFSLDDMLHSSLSSMTRVRAGRDAFPNGLSVAMAPVTVDWRASSPGFGPEHYYILRSVNLTANPVAGDVLLGTVRVHAGSVARIEWVFVVSKVGRRDTQAGHAMIRFVFKEDRCPNVVSIEGDTIGHNLKLADLVFSWEAWRPPLAKFDPVAGLDPRTYALTLRCFNGPARCLSDAVFNRPWTCYPLNVPDIPHAADEVLYTCLLFGDALARQTYGAMFDERISEMERTPDGYEDYDRALWEGFRQTIADNAIPDNPVDDFLGGKTSYHLLQRSCVTMALTVLDAAHVRMRSRAGLKPPQRVRVVSGDLPAFVRDVGSGNRRSALLGIPAAIHWLARNQTVIPGKAHELLDEVGLLRWRRGEILKSHYDNRETSPYGRLSEHLIY